MTRPIRVLLVDDHETVRQGLRLLVQAQPDMDVVGEAGDGAAALACIATLHPTVVVLDISMPAMNGLEVTRTLKRQASSAAIVALTRHDDTAYVQELLGAGAAAYVLKQSPSTELLRAIRACAAGERYTDASIVNRASDYRMRQQRGGQEAPRISDRETEVLRAMAIGQSNKEIASELNISVKTVEVHKANAMRKLGLRGRIDIVRYALLQGWLRDP